MEIEVKKYMTFNDLMRECWSGAISTLETIQENDKEDELMQLLENLYYENIPTLTQVNDLLWFDYEFVFEELEIDEDDDKEDEE